ncbi:MAG TPA: TonB-dependent receptor [Gammaproteobacteria bacterium]|nr:TonB-dependent receptor [Gammaproteobacteria bacterium]
MIINRKFHTVCLTLALLGLAPAAVAQPGIEEEVIVSSPRVDTALDRVAGAISVVSQDEIQLGQQQLTLDESLARVPGVFMQNRHNFSQALRISIRGFGARSPFGIRGIKLMIDGVPATLPDGQGNVDEIDLGSAARIEVIRGPAASLYGSAAAGVISVYTEDGLDDPFAQARVSGGRYGYEQLQFKTGGQAGQLNYLGSLSLLDNDGYRDNAYVERRVLNGKLRYDINDSSDLTATVNLLDVPKMGDPGALNAGELATNRRRANPGALTFDGSEGRAQERIGFVYRNELGANHEFTLRNYYSWLDFENKLPFTGGVANSNGGQVEFDRSFAGIGGQYTYTGQLRGRSNRLIVGMDVDRQNDDRRRYENLAGGSRGALTFDQTEKVSSVGVFAQNEFALSEAVELIVGARYDQIDFDISDRFLLNNSGDDSGSSDFSETSHRIGLLWTVSEQANFYTNYSTAFETPTTTEFANPSGGGFNRNLTSQTVESVEVGVKGRLATDTPLRYDFATFHIVVDDELVPFEVDGFTGRTFFQNAGESTREGFEAALSAQLLPTLNLSFAYSYIDAKFDRFETATDSFAGSEIPGVPEDQIYLELNYRHARGWYGVLDALYVSDFYAENANLVRTDSYTVSNLRLGYDGRVGDFDVSPFIGIFNLLDEEYNSNVRINAGFGRYYEPAPDRSAFAGVTLRYAFR